MNDIEYLKYPFDSQKILAKKRKIKKAFLLDSTTPFIEKKIAILGGSTTLEIRDILDLFLLSIGIKASFYESDYNKFYEDIIFDNPELEAFSPDFIYIHTTNKNLLSLPSVNMKSTKVEKLLNETFLRFQGVWESAQKKYACMIIQNNFELPFTRLMGNYDASLYSSEQNFITKLNQKMVTYASENHTFLINDIHYLSASMGLQKWYDARFWHSYQYAMSHEAIPYLTYNIASIVKAALGRSKKCLVLDLDNTLWGGVIGDDGIDGISLGSETPMADAYLSFQKYIKRLQERGIILAICSKNEYSNALLGLSHPDSQLNKNDFAVIVANWEPKSENIKAIAKDLNIGLDSLVFIDDNPAEREIVQQQLSMVTVPNIGNDIVHYISIIDKALFFETISLSLDDLNRNSTYQENVERLSEQEKFQNYNEYLKSLEMKAIISPFETKYLDRITQLINKTNQFNLTTKRYTQAEIETISQNQNYMTLYGRLEDKFGDNGLISVIIGKKKDKELEVELWIMSCRVLKRGMEYAMFGQIIEYCKAHGIDKIVGRYIATSKNNMVANHYENLGFSKQDSQWVLRVGEVNMKDYFIDIEEDML